MTSIGSEVFRYCSALESIIVESGNPVYDSRDNCNAIINSESNELIAGCSKTIIPNSVTRIGYCAFKGTGLISLTIPNSITSIGSGIIAYCKNLKQVICYIENVPRM